MKVKQRVLFDMYTSFGQPLHRYILLFCVLPVLVHFFIAAPLCYCVFIIVHHPTHLAIVK